MARKPKPFAKYERLTADLARYAEKRGIPQEDFDKYQKYLKTEWLDQQKAAKAWKPTTSLKWENWKLENSDAKYLSNIYVGSGTFTKNYTVTIEALANFQLTTSTLTQQIKDLEGKISAFGIKIADFDLGSSPINLVNGDTLQITGTFTVPSDGIPSASSKGKGPASEPK